LIANKQITPSCLLGNGSADVLITASCTPAITLVIPAIRL